MGKFVHLHVHSEYSLLDGSSRIGELPQRAKELGMEAIALTDHGNMYGSIAFYKACQKEGIKPIMGCEVYVSEGDYLVKDRNMKRFHLILLAENNEGYRNLMKIVSEGFVNGYYYKPRIDESVLQKYHRGLIATSACMAGEVQRHILNRDMEKAKEAALKYQKIFGMGNFFLELQDHGIADQQRVNRGLVQISQELGIGLIATNDVHYLRKEDHIAHDVLLCIQTGTTVNEKNRMRFPTDEFYLKSPEEMELLFSEYPQALNNTVQIADRCSVTLTFHDLHLPHFLLPQGYTNEEYLRTLALQGLEQRYPNYGKEISDRFEYEFETITKMGYTDYFLIVWDFIRYAKENGIMVGPGRGSAAGSIISYALNIIDVDPLKFNLLFERFLNPERVSMPDIDIDFCYERREEVIDYVVKKYGKSHVAQIATFGTMASRGAIRDVGRALDMPYNRVDYIAKQVPAQLNMTLDRALEVSEKFKEVYESDEETRHLIDMARKVEGLPRHTSTHAAGVVISKDELTEYVPLTRNGDIIATQFNMTELEELGLLKMDFLGLRTLTVIRDTCRFIQKNYGVDIDFDRFSYDDPKVLEMFAKAHTLGVFQFESSGMRLFLKELKPDAFEDLVAANALFRPGPMKQIPKFVQAKHDPSTISYLHPKLEPILNVTYGCIVYQEQVMQIVQKIGGYSLGRADIVRRAISKKKMAVMEEERHNFIYGNPQEGVCGAIANGVDEVSANKIYDLIIDFADYAFNKSHSVAYSVVAYHTAWLKYYYPKEFMAAQISTYTADIKQVSLYIEEIKRLKIELLPPNVNFSFKHFTVEKGKIRFGLKAVKNVGDSFIDTIVKAREKGPFPTLADFITRVSRVDSASVNKRALESLIRCGAFDDFPGNRAQYLAVYEKLLASSSQSVKNNVAGQFSLFDQGVTQEDLPKLRDFQQRDKLAMEKEVIGIYVSGHPLDPYKEVLQQYAQVSTNDVFEWYVENPQGMERKVSMAGVFKSKKTMLTKNNKVMCFGVLEDFFGTIEVIVFPNSYAQYYELLEEDSVLAIKGHLSSSDVEEPKIIVEHIEKILLPSSKKLYISVETIQEGGNLQGIRKVLKQYHGLTPVVIYAEDQKMSFGTENKLWIDEKYFDNIKIDLLNYVNHDPNKIILK